MAEQRSHAAGAMTMAWMHSRTPLRTMYRKCPIQNNTVLYALQLAVHVYINKAIYLV